MSVIQVAPFTPNPPHPLAGRLLSARSLFFSFYETIFVSLGVFFFLKKNALFMVSTWCDNRFLITKDHALVSFELFEIESGFLWVFRGFKRVSMRVVEFQRVSMANNGFIKFNLCFT